VAFEVAMLEVDALGSAGLGRESDFHFAGRARSGSTAIGASCHAMTSRRRRFPHDHFAPVALAPIDGALVAAAAGLRLRCGLEGGFGQLVAARPPRVESCLNTVKARSALVFTLIVLRTGVFVVSATLVRLSSSAAVLKAASAWVQTDRSSSEASTPAVQFVNPAMPAARSTTRRAFSDPQKMLGDGRTLIGSRGRAGPPVAGPFNQAFEDRAARRIAEASSCCACW